MIEIRHKSSGKVLLRIDAESLDGANLIGAKLAGADLSDCNINHACLRDADLQGARFDRAQLIGSSFDGANLANASFDAADLTDASLQQADLNRAQMCETTLRYAKLSGANLLHARMTGANLSMADVRANLRGANLQSADLRGANLTGANLQQADLFQANLAGATITRASVSGARMQGANMQGVINDEITSRVEATTRASVIRRNPASSPGNSHAGCRVVVRCPFCNQSQEIPPQRVEHHSRCAACRERFFVDRAGNAVEPRRVDPNQWTPELSTTELPRTTEGTWEWPTQLNKPLLIATVVLLFCVVAWTAFAALRGPAYELPESLQARADFVCHAFLAADIPRLQAITYPGTAEFLDEWLQDTRSGEWTYWKPDALPKVSSRLLFENKSQGRAGVMTELIGDRPPEDPQAEVPTLLTFWQQSADGQWLLDAESNVLGALKQR